MIAGNSSGAALNTFAMQFEPDGDGYLYRNRMKGAPIRVSAEERDDFVAAFSRRYKYFVWGSVGALITCVVIQVAYHLADIWLYASISVFFLLAIIFFYRVYDAPARELRSRSASGAPRSKKEAKQAFLMQMPYGQLVGITVAWIFVVLKMIRGNDWFAGWNPLWLALGVLGVGAMCFRVFQKWRLEQSVNR